MIVGWIRDLRALRQRIRALEAANVRAREDMHRAARRAREVAAELDDAARVAAAVDDMRPAGESRQGG